MSGSAAIATVGVDEQDGEQLALEQINSSHFLGNSQIKLNLVDTQASQPLAVQAVAAEIQAKDAAVVGFTLSPSFLAAGPALQKAQIPTIAVGLSGVGITEVGNYIFRVYGPLDTLYARTDPEIVKAFGWKTAAYIYDSDSSNTTDQNNTQEKIMTSLGVKTVSVQSTTSDAISYQTQLTAIKAKHPDVLVPGLNGGQIPTLLNQMTTAGLNVVQLGGVSYGTPNVYSLKQANCTVFDTTWDPSDTTGKNPQFISTWTAKYKRPPSEYGAWGYDGMWLLATGLKDANSTSGPALRNALANLKSFSGALGVYGFDAQRDPTGAGVLLQVQNGKLVPWTPTTTCTR